jgi:hypothetical protein
MTFKGEKNFDGKIVKILDGEFWKDPKITFVNLGFFFCIGLGSSYDTTELLCFRWF